MPSLNESFITQRHVQRQAGFTLMELTFAVALFGAFAVVTILAFTTFNRFASNARYETLALSVAQERMDEVMTSPCVTNTTTTLGPVLELSGTTVSPSSSNVYTSVVENNLPLNNDAYNMTRETDLSGSTPLPLTITLTGTISAGSEDTQVIDTRTTSFAPVTGNVRLMTVTVAVAYTYRGTHYTISLSGVRATDNF